MRSCNLGNQQRELAVNLFMAGVEAAEPESITKQAVVSHHAALDHGPITIIAIGKASIPMMRGALDALGEREVARSIAVTNRENWVSIDGVDVFPAGHPVPDTEGAVASQKIMETVASLTSDDVLLFLISGGTSAMLPAPAGELTLQDEVAATEVLLASGAPIDAVNRVRSRLSKVKGGGLSRLAGETPIVTLMLSDVPGDVPAIIGSGPTITSTVSDEEIALTIRDYNLEARLDAAVMSHLRRSTADEETKIGPRHAEVIGSNKISLNAVCAAARKLGIHVEVVSDWLEGDVQEAADKFAASAQQCDRWPSILVAGGETTVQLVGDGKGGRNQELALRFAASTDDIVVPWVFLSGGTDGRDGPTDAAGGLVDHTTLSRLGQEHAEKALANNDAYHALLSCGDLLITGGTGTNVADLQILVLGSINADTL